jgi:hypothetical protein
VSHGYEEAYTVAAELKRLIAVDPALVRDAYAALFEFEETSTAPNAMGSSQILAMTSNRRQDYDMAHYELARQFPAFLGAAPEQAGQALVAAVRGYIRHHHPHRFEKYEGGSFDFMGQRARLEPDGSCMWDEGGVYRKDHAVEMLQALEDYLATASQEARLPAALKVVATLAMENRAAVVWRRVLVAGAKDPEGLGREVRELVWAEPVLRGLDTSVRAGELIRRLMPTLAAAERQRVEETIVNLVTVEPGEEQEWSKNLRDRLLGCLPPDLVTSGDARGRIAELQAAGGVPDNEPLFRMSVGSWGEVSIEDRLQREGVDVHVGRNREILALRQSVADLQVSEGLLADEGNRLPGAIGQLRALLESLHRESGVDVSVERNAWGSLAEAAARFARLELPVSGGVAQLILEILLEAAVRPEPDSDPRHDIGFDEHPSWGSPAPRIEAAEGLMLLARQRALVTDELLGCIDNLSLDSAPAVRLQVASRLWLLNKTAPDRMWAAVERMSTQDSSTGVLRWLVNDSLGRLAQLDAHRVIRLVRAILARFDSGPGVGELRDRCWDILTGWYVWRDEQEAREALFQLAATRPLPVSDAGYVCGDLRQAVIAEKGPGDLTGDGVRARAIGLVGAFLTPALTELEDLLDRVGVSGEQPATVEHRERIRELIGFADLVGRELYFATGIFQEHDQSGTNEERLSPGQRDRLISESWTLIESLAAVGLAPIAHHLLEILEAYIPADPRRAFLMIGKILIAGVRGHYQYESLAEGLFVRLIERYLAEYRTLFQEDGECRDTLLKVLDIFVQAGWPTAQRLSYRLDEIFR